MRYHWHLLCTFALIGGSCTPPSPDLSQEEDAIRAVDSEMVAALNAHDIEGWLSHFAPNARMMPPGEPAAVGIEAIRSLITGFMSPALHVVHDFDGVVISRSADLAYVWYSYELTFAGPDGVPVTERGKDVSVYTKGAGDSWKLAVDMWSENQM